MKNTVLYWMVVVVIVMFVGFISGLVGVTPSLSIAIVVGVALLALIIKLILNRIADAQRAKIVGCTDVRE